jgi:hypothetical protein
MYPDIVSPFYFSLNITDHFGEWLDWLDECALDEYPDINIVEGITVTCIPLHMYKARDLTFDGCGLRQFFILL